MSRAKLFTCNMDGEIRKLPMKRVPRGAIITAYLRGKLGRFTYTATGTATAHVRCVDTLTGDVVNIAKREIQSISFPREKLVPEPDEEDISDIFSVGSQPADRHPVSTPSSTGQGGAMGEAFSGNSMDYSQMQFMQRMFMQMMQSMAQGMGNVQPETTQPQPSRRRGKASDPSFNPFGTESGSSEENAVEYPDGYYDDEVHVEEQNEIETKSDGEEEEKGSNQEENDDGHVETKSDETRSQSSRSSGRNTPAQSPAKKTSSVNNRGNAKRTTNTPTTQSQKGKKGTKTKRVNHDVNELTNQFVQNCRLNDLL